MRIARPRGRTTALAALAALTLVAAACGDDDDVDVGDDHGSGRCRVAHHDPDGVDGLDADDRRR